MVVFSYLVFLEFKRSSYHGVNKIMQKLALIMGCHNMTFTPTGKNISSFVLISIWYA